jgi:hypothetical protein
VLSASDGDDGSHERADHLVEERVADHVDDHGVLRARSTDLPPHADAEQAAHAAVLVVHLRGEGAEIVLPLQVLCGLGHRGDVEPLGDVPGRVLERTARRPVEDAVAVVLAARRVAGVKVARDLAHAADGYVLGEERVQPGEESLGREPGARLEARDLPEGVYARVRAARRDDANVFLGDFGEGSFELAHAGSQVGLNLPACEAASRILDQQLDIACGGR